MTAPSRLQLETLPLEGKSIRLEPYEDAVKDEVRTTLDCDSEAWNLFAISGQGIHFEQWWSHILHEVQAGQWIAYAIRDLGNRKIVGTTSFLNIKHARCCVEIGATFIHPTSRSGHVNPESKYLMLQHAFRSGARRVELLTDLRNVRSQAAIAKLGAVKEGVLRRERVTWTGHVRDSVLYSITDSDWPGVRQNLGARLVQLGRGVP